jgi:hypothetical protein
LSAVHVRLCLFFPPQQDAFNKEKNHSHGSHSCQEKKACFNNQTSNQITEQNDCDFGSEGSNKKEGIEHQAGNKVSAFAVVDIKNTSGKTDETPIIRARMLHAINFFSEFILLSPFHPIGE